MSVRHEAVPDAAAAFIIRTVQPKSECIYGHPVVINVHADTPTFVFARCLRPV